MSLISTWVLISFLISDFETDESGFVCLLTWVTNLGAPDLKN